jgi:hypothetical protein
MGPPIFVGGDHEDALLSVEDRNASMGPPIFVGGDHDSLRPSAPRARPLQWGRRSSSAETSPYARVSKVAWLLQWGRRSSSAETSTTSTRACARRSFNGAADLRRRRRGQDAQMALGARQLQWGRRSSSAETAGSNSSVTPSTSDGDFERWCPVTAWPHGRRSWWCRMSSDYGQMHLASGHGGPRGTSLLADASGVAIQLSPAPFMTG